MLKKYQNLGYKIAGSIYESWNIGCLSMKTLNFLGTVVKLLFIKYILIDDEIIYAVKIKLFQKSEFKQIINPYACMVNYEINGPRAS